MRILHFFLQVLILCIFISLFVYFWGGQLWLKVGTYQFIQDGMSLPAGAKQLEAYTQMCAQAPSSSDASTPIGMQLRFNDNTSYSIELVCSLIENSPIHIKDGKLPPLISKDPGSAGFFYSFSGDNLASVSLSSLGKHQIVMLKNDSVYLSDTDEASQNQYPQSVCTSFGYSCCNNQSNVGVGDVRSLGVVDCPTACYRSCTALPYVELFDTDPAVSVSTRETVMKSASQDFIFNYGVHPSVATEKVTTVHIDYGDGQSQDSTQAEGIFTHTYTCQTSCRFTVKLTISDTAKKTSIESPGSIIYIVKR
ncbi:hypothetical protein C5B42_04855 [Candidatus Cerribacteria bacterium 'Amazon FNV 2010 28 9']|uniref:PKD domain-containing protein n=1 Tax=Candidatus Cerribacteria bacterium 'Amazon FNV 2010 28 9' TaxID=2081795 RepID=A0A317JSS5_9BACT|nr:MAG: hypothetical protein C5B42_04855 [Candidatus Cerribacteria bacterium 'Amazon FNV 2010 28 9']